MKYDFPMICGACFERLICYMQSLFGQARSFVLCKIWGVSCSSPRRCFSGAVVLRCRHKGEIVIGDGTIVNSRYKTNLVGLVGPSIIDTRFGGRVVIGEGSGFSSPVISSMASITIGDHVMVGGNVRIFDHDFHPLESEYRRAPQNRNAIRSCSIVIEDDVFIGTNSIILKGTHIGARSIVAAGSVVFGLNVPPDSLVKGNPAIIVEKG